MDNPYKVLGLSDTATDDEVKAAYKRLAKQYHPDINKTPEAEKRMKEINEAYTRIMKGDKGATYTSHQTWYEEPAGESGKLAAARNYINAGYFREALNVLNAISERDARWYYYSAVANSGLGARTQALDHAQRAVSMDPNNLEYRRFLQQLQTGTQRYQQFGSGFGAPIQGMGGLCMGLCLMRMCCPFCGYPCC